MTITSPRLESLARSWQWQTAARDVLCALAVANALGVLALVFPGIPGFVAVLGFVLVLSGRLALSRPWELDAATLARHLDRSYPALEESSVLWLRPAASLTLLERLQLKRLNTAADGLTQETASTSFGAPPRRYLRAAAGYFLASLLALSIAVALRREHTVAASRPSTVPATRPPTATPPPAAPAWPKITGAELLIVPPAYTGHPARRLDGLNAEVEEGATVTWRLALDRPVRDARLVFGQAGADALPLRPVPGADHRLESARPLTDTTLYHLAATLPDGAVWSPPEIYSLKIIRDRPPTVRIEQPALPRTVLDPPAAPFLVECFTTDDYGLAEAHLVATVAKGSGEAVKFREQAIAFDTNDPAPGGRRLTKKLDLAALGLEPGDELYFFVEASDNRQPIANRTRSETRFVVIKGPTEVAAAGGLGVGGVNLIPQYFRSERQIIIDTEKLIADQPSLAREEVASRANDLGVDQELLRLRYGQFAGEDLEQDAVTDHTEIHLDPLQAAPVERTGPHAAASVALRFRQEHTEQDREGADEEHGTGSRAASGQPLAAAQVRSPFVDSHDNQDKATFLDHETKGTLHDALTAMWAAEGLLRTTRLPEALAPEHRALDILKALQQSDRAYVQHVGFEPAPLQIATRRLQGDVTTVPARADGPPAGAADAGTLSGTDVRAALAAVPWNQALARLSPAQMAALRRTEPALTAAATRQPEVYLDGLRALRGWLAGNDGDLPSLEEALLHLLPAAHPLPGRESEAAASLAQPYFQALAGAGAP